MLLKSGKPLTWHKSRNELIVRLNSSRKWISVSILTVTIATKALAWDTKYDYNYGVVSIAIVFID